MRELSMVDSGDSRTVSRVRRIIYFVEEKREKRVKFFTLVFDEEKCVWKSSCPA